MPLIIPGLNKRQTTQENKKLNSKGKKVKNDIAHYLTLIKQNEHLDFNDASVSDKD